MNDNLLGIFAVGFLIGGLIIGSLSVFADRTQRENIEEIAVENTANDIVTETEVYRMRCTEIGNSVCLQYSILRVNKE